MKISFSETRVTAEKVTIRSALDQAAEEDWQCATCSAAAEESSQYCMSCGLYWQDVENGLHG